MTQKRKYGLWLALGLLGISLSACQAESTSAAKAQAKPAAHLVYTTQVTRQPLYDETLYTGSLRTQRLLRVYSQEPGRIMRLPFYPGERVKSGELLMQLDDRRLQAELAKAKATLSQTQVDVKRLRNLGKNKLVSEDEQARAETALAVATAEVALLQVRLTDTAVYAPFAGVISERLAEPGDLVPSSNPVLTLLAPDSLVVDVLVPEQRLAQIRVDDNAVVRIDALGDTPWQAKIARIYPAVDPVSRLGQLELHLTAQPPAALPGQFCRVLLRTQGQARPSIPYTALRRDREGEYVFMLNTDNTVTRRPVRSGLQLAESIEIIEGLQPDEVIVSKGFLGLSDGKTVVIANAAAAS